jgi:hypothetical protein
MTTLVVLFILGLAPHQETQKEKPRIPKDSIEIVVTGCLKGRVLAVSETRRTDVESGPDIRARSFRLAGKKDVMKLVKEEDGHLVDVTGIIKKSSVYEEGMKVGKGIRIGSGRPIAGSGGVPAPDPSQYVPVMDVETVRQRATSCGG